jgi:hypothetical protein
MNTFKTTRITAWPSSVSSRAHDTTAGLLVSLGTLLLGLVLAVNLSASLYAPTLF